MNFRDYEDRAQRTAHHTKHLGIYYPAMKLAGEAGEVTEKIAKVYRDNDGQFDADRKLALLYELGDVLWYLQEIGNRLGMSLEMIARANIKKLSDRESRGVIKGDGDNR